MYQIKNKTIFHIILFFSIFAIFFAYFVEYVLGHKPCNLCLYERIPYFLTIAIIFLIFLLKKFEKKFILILFLIFVSSSILSFYHYGIEQGFIKESLVCNVKGDNLNLSKENLLKELKQELISCKDVSFRIFGLSLATINTIISLIFSAILLNLFFKYDKSK
tara:strand:- start:783 stop:1268 length:486 start_codon:yes stop_codon:yes gene_type:complete